MHAASFGFQNSTYTVGEAGGFVRVCLVVSNFNGILFAGK